MRKWSKTARARIDEIETADLIAAHKQGTLSGRDLIIIDLRDPRERQRDGYIPNSFHAPRGMVEFWVDPQSPYFKPIFANQNAAYVFHCASGWRSALTVSTLQDMGFAGAHLKFGFADWLKLGGPVHYDPQH